MMNVSNSRGRSAMLHCARNARWPKCQRECFFLENTKKNINVPSDTECSNTSIGAFQENPPVVTYIIRLAEEYCGATSIAIVTASLVYCTFFCRNDQN